ncbi:hypothetical protein BGX23_009210 [Mortierella sp. AD031]|nr:hypothetical protein BGX23_009210 [Mortierella sp. AD031]
MQDCYERLVEKEGAKSLWRGYSVEWGRILVQKSLEMRLNRRGTFALRRWMSMNPQSSGGTTGWLLATAVEGTVIGAAALAVVYPLSVVHAKMATDVVRKTRRVRKVVKTHVDGSRKGAKDVKEEEKVESSTESISGDSVEWVEHTAEDNENDQEPTVSTPILEGELSVAETKDTTEKDILTTTAKTTTTYEYEYELSYKYKTFRQVFNETLASSEGYLGFYKGFSTVVASAFVSRLGLMTIYTIKSLCAGGPGGVVFSPFQVFITQTALSVLTYPLTTVGNRRMIAAPGRYSSSWEAAQQIVERQGWQALFKGVEVVVVRSVVLATLSHLLL